MDLPKQFHNSRLILSKKNLYISIFYIIFIKRTKIELLKLEQNMYKKNMICKNHNKKLPNDGENYVSS